ncbi:MAG: IS66 family transposase [Anaerolineales bacterium]|nr:IS66 family transposase [Anaerolineales bacterium]
MDAKPGPILPYAIPAASGAAFLSPEDVGRLLDELASSRETIARHEAALRAAELEIQSLTQHKQALKAAELKIQALTLELAHHKRMRFGQKSEALAAAGQRELFEETLLADRAAIEEELAQAERALKPKAPRKPRARAGRQPLPTHLPRVEHRHEPESCTCGQCGSALVKIGEDVSEQLDVEPAKFTVHRHIRPQYACKRCETVVAAPVPPAVIDGGLAAAGLLVWVIISKFADHLPLYRLAQIAARQGVTLALPTLADWVGRIGVALQPLTDRLAWHLKQEGVLHADETPIQQLDPGGGKTKKAYLWAYRSNGLGQGPPIVVFDYQASRAGEHPKAFLKGWHGHLMVDDYAGYKALFSDGAVVELGCMAHARRKFFDLAQANGSPVAARALRHIGRLYRIEAMAKGQDAEVRQRLRAKHAKPRLRLFHAWLVKTRAGVPNGSGTAKAIDYSLKRWEALARYAGTGHLPIDNNALENDIRPIAVGRKGWLFTGSERAGKRAASIQTLVGTARLNGIDPAAWLKDTLEKLPTWPASRIDELLPLRRDQKTD